MYMYMHACTHVYIHEFLAFTLLAAQSRSVDSALPEEATVNTVHFRLHPVQCDTYTCVPYDYNNNHLS